MKLLLIAINSKYIHTNISIRYLEKYIKSEIEKNNDGIEVDTLELSINNSYDYILKKIYKAQADIICFSTYIWNIELINEISIDIKKLLNESIIIYGGPEASFESEDLMKSNENIDIIIKNEGEQALLEVITNIYNNDFDIIEKALYRVKGDIIKGDKKIKDKSFNDVYNFPYDDIELQDNRIFYFESSRGCPYNCSYCLSSTIKGIDYLDLDKVNNAIKKFLDNNVKQVKFIDRTFNSNEKRAIEIIEYIKKHHNNITNFHFEISPNLVTDKFLNLLKTLPVGMIQFEIGIQSTNDKTLKEINRNMKIDDFKENIKRIIELKNIHTHLDLIAGLPYEGFNSLKTSFNDVLKLRPDKLQLGFLKLLKGSYLKEKYKSSYIFKQSPPYEVLENDWLDFNDIINLKDIETILDFYFNDKLFDYSIEYILSELYESDFEFFNDMSDYYNEKDYFSKSLSVDDKFIYLHEFLSDKFNIDNEKKHIISDLMALDYYLKSKKAPNWDLYYSPILKGELHDFIEFLKLNTEVLNDFSNETNKQIIKSIKVFKLKTNDLSSLKINLNIKIHLIDSHLSSEYIVIDYKNKKNHYLINK